jgi:hypothetical protein
MSFEILLLLFVFLVLPLLEQLVRNARKRHEQAAPPDAATRPPRPEAPRRPMPEEWDEALEEEEEVVPVRVPPPPPPVTRPAPEPVRQPAPPVQRVPAGARPKMPRDIFRGRPAPPREVLLARQAREARLRTAAADPGDPHVLRRRRRRARLAGELAHPAGLRRAVVFMTVLGPCRANEPYEGTRPQGTRPAAGSRP